MAAVRPKKFSGLQKEVLNLYRQCLRSVRSKPADKRVNWYNYIHSEFNKYRGIPKRNFAAIEHLLRAGNKRYEMYKSELITDVH